MLLLTAAVLATTHPAHALMVTKASVRFGQSWKTDRVRVSGYIEGLPQSIEAFPSVKVDLGTFSETIPTSLFRQLVDSDGAPLRSYRYYAPAERRRNGGPLVISLLLDFQSGRFTVDARSLALARATNPMPFRLVAGQGDQCVMLQFAERPAYTTIYDLDPVTGDPIPGTDRQAINGSVRGKWTFLRDATQPSCEIRDFEAQPSGFPVGHSAFVRLESRILNPTVAHPQVFAVDQNLELMPDPICDLHDDGRNGDDIAGDRVHTCVAEFFEEQPRAIRLIVRASYDGEHVLSPKIELDVVPQLIEEDAAVFIENLYRARDLWGEKLSQSGNSLATRQQTAAAMKALPYVRDVAFNDSAFLLEFAIDNAGGILGYLPALGNESRSAPIPPGGSSDLPSVPEPPTPASFALYENVNTFLYAQAAQQPEDNRVKNAGVLVWAPDYARSFPNDELNDLRHRFATAGCPRFDVRLLRDEECTLDSVRHFADYGTIIVATGGQYAPPFILERDRIIDSRPVFATGERVRASDAVLEIANLYIRDRLDALGVLGLPERKMPRLVFYFGDNGVTWGIRPEFIQELPGRFPESVVFAGWGYSGRNQAFSQAFLAAGAQTFFGFTDVPTEAFVRESIVGIFDRMLDLDNAAEAYAGLPTILDPYGPQRAVLRMHGDRRPTYEGLFGVLNGGFESGTLKSWKKVGDSRAVVRLGPYFPREGAFMGQISTGLGSNVDLGSIRQRVCVPAGRSRLAFDWNLLSEEFRNYCNTRYDDSFEVRLNDSLVFRRNVNGLCGGSLSSVGGLTFDARDDVWASGWQSASLDVSSIVGNEAQTVDLQFAVGDASDTDFDTAILLDRIRFE